MSEVEKKLAAMGLQLPDVVTPVAVYQPAVRSGTQIYTSGQVPIVDGKLLRTGKVGAEVSLEDAKHLARICALNALAAVKSVAGDLDRVHRIVRVVGFVASTPQFTAQPDVVNGASVLLAHIFGDKGLHARSAVGVAVLPLDAPVEVEIHCELSQPSGE